MKNISQKISLSTRGHNDIVDITPLAEEIVTKSEISDGTVTLFVIGSTAGVTTMEYEPGQIKDLKNLMDRLVPKRGNYEHNLAWGDGNGHSHLRASLVGPSLTVPIVKKSMTLGTWQQIVVIDFDNRSRTREVLVKVIGE